MCVDLFGNELVSNVFCCVGLGSCFWLWFYVADEVIMGCEFVFFVWCENFGIFVGI